MAGLSLHEVVREGKPDSLRILLSQGVNVNEKLDSSTELTPLHLAVGGHNIEISRLLMNSGADPDRPDHEGNSPLHHAVYYGDQAMVQLLVDAGASVNVRNNRDFTPLYWTLCRVIREKKVDEEDLGILKTLLKAKADANVSREDGKTPLHLAVNIGSLEVVKLLLGACARVNERRGDGKTPVHLATISGNLEILRTLMKVDGVDVCIKDNLERTAVQYALDCWNFVAVRVLVDAGADVDTRSTELDRAALHLAVEKNDASMIEYLLSRGADVDARDHNGQTPLHCATSENQGESHLGVIRMLLEAKADPEARDLVGKTPVDYLESYDETSAGVFEFLFKHSAVSKSSTRLEDSGDNEERKLATFAEIEKELEDLDVQTQKLAKVEKRIFESKAQGQRLDELERKIEDLQRKVQVDRFGELEQKIDDLQRNSEDQRLDELEQKVEVLRRNAEKQRLDELEQKIEELEKKVGVERFYELEQKIEDLQKKVETERFGEPEQKIEALQRNAKNQSLDELDNKIENEEGEAHSEKFGELERKIEDMQGKVIRLEENSTFIVHCMLLITTIFFLFTSLNIYSFCFILSIIVIIFCVIA